MTSYFTTPEDDKKPTIFGREPAVILGLVSAAVALAASFGFELDGEQVGALMAVTAAVLSLVTRHLVVPTSTVVDGHLPE